MSSFSTIPALTGGIGTTIFYVAGKVKSLWDFSSLREPRTFCECRASILVLAAVILLVTKRRMGADE